MRIDQHFKNLPDYIEGFEARSGQFEMASQVEQVLQQGLTDDGLCSTLVVEAETGVGKTLGYLIPAVESGRKVVISTATLNLQDQILNKEIPLVSKLVGRDINAVCVKGRQNYLCHFKWNQHRYGPQKELFADHELEKIEKWLQETETGDRAELQWLPDRSPLWKKISSPSHQCLGGECPDGTFCFIGQMRKRAAKADLILTNHHLLFSDLALRKDGFGEVLPRYEAVIFDEAHHLENIATVYFGKTSSKYQFYDLFSDLRAAAEERLDPDSGQKLADDLRGIKERVDRFFSLLPEKKGRHPLQELVKSIERQWAEEGESVVLALDRLLKELQELSVQDDVWEAMAERTSRIEKQFLETSSFEYGTDRPSVVHWYEKTEKNSTISITPVEVAAELEQTLYSKVDVCIFTSATLSSGGDFSYFRSRIGIPVASQELQIGSPFDYAGRTRLYVPDTTFPEPSAPQYQDSFNLGVEKLIRLAKGRTLVLCTSFRSMDLLADYLQDCLPYSLLVQGSQPRMRLLEEFKADTHSVLLAVASFWEGVDVVGDSLGCVVIDKLPFEVPTDPVLQARIEAVKQGGGNPFYDYQVPRAVLTLRQGVGRLMRSSNDCGLIAVMDVRLFSKGYGKRFLKSLPPSPVIRDIEEVKQFFSCDIEEK